MSRFGTPEPRNTPWMPLRAKAFSNGTVSKVSVGDPMPIWYSVPPLSNMSYPWRAVAPIPTTSKTYFTPKPSVSSLTAATGSTSAELMMWVAPNFLAASSDAALTSTEMILPALANTAPDTALSPTPASPRMATSSPARTLAAFSTAPVAVITPQPMTAARANGISFGNLTSIFSCTSDCCAKPQSLVHENMQIGRSHV